MWGWKVVLAVGFVVWAWTCRAQVVTYDVPLDEVLEVIDVQVSPLGEVGVLGSAPLELGSEAHRRRAFYGLVRNGALVWSGVTESDGHDDGAALAVDWNRSRMYIAGSTLGTFGDVDPVGQDLFVLGLDMRRRDATPDLVWQGGSDGGADRATAILLVSDGRELVIGGRSSSFIRGYNGTLKGTFVGRYRTEDMSLVWGRQLGEHVQDRVEHLAVDDIDQLYVLGIVQYNPPGEEEDVLIENPILYRLHGPTSTLIWTHKWPESPSRHSARGIAADAGGNVHVVVERELSDFDPILSKHSKISRNGQLLWSKVVPTSDDVDSQVFHVGTTIDGRVHVAGQRRPRDESGSYSTHWYVEDAFGTAVHADRIGRGAFSHAAMDPVSGRAVVARPVQDGVLKLGNYRWNVTAEAADVASATFVLARLDVADLRGGRSRTDIADHIADLVEDHQRLPGGEYVRRGAGEGEEGQLKVELAVTLLNDTLSSSAPPEEAQINRLRQFFAGDALETALDIELELEAMSVETGEAALPGEGQPDRGEQCANRYPDWALYTASAIAVASLFTSIILSILLARFRRAHK